MVVQLHRVVEEEKEERDPDHPLDREVEGPHLATTERGAADKGLEPGPTSLPRGPLHFVSLGQD